MKKRKQLPTRRRRALRWLAALVVLVLGCHLLGTYCLTPERVLRKLEQRRHTGETEFLWRDDAPMGMEKGSLRLSGSDHAAILCLYRFYWNGGWRAGSTDYAERRADQPFSAAHYQGWGKVDRIPANDIDYHYVFGAVEDPAITELIIEFDAIEGGHDQTARLTAADWILNEDGDRFFLCALEPEVGNYSRACSVVGVYEDGSLTKRLQLMGSEPKWE